MKQIMKKLVPFMLAFVLLASCGAFAKAETADDAAEAAALMENIKGTYEALFPVITKPEYDQIWLDPCVAAAGEEAGPQMAEMLKAACNGTIYGQEAVDAFGDGSNGAQFDCAFINGVSTITFDGAVISGADENGNQVFSHEYTYAGSLSLGGMMEGYLFETVDEDAGEFKYFYMMPDTPAASAVLSIVPKFPGSWIFSNIRNFVPPSISSKVCSGFFTVQSTPCGVTV